MAGDHVPVIPFVEVVGNVGATEPEHIDEGNVKVGAVELVQLPHVIVVGATQGYPSMDVIFNVALCPGKTPIISKWEMFQAPVTNGPPLMEYV